MSNLNDMNLLRWVSDNSGQVTDPQLLTLKRTALLIGCAPVEMRLDQEKKHVAYHFQGRSKKLADVMIQKATAAILGPSWKTEVNFETPNEQPKRTSGKDAQRKRAGRLSKVRRKR